MELIPKVIHQIWIGHLPPPQTLLRTWKEKNPDYEYILWDEARIARELPNQTCQTQVQIIPEINGKADILRWEILYEYGGFFFDADSVCLNPLMEEFREVSGNGFSCYENEIMREGLIACGSMGFIPKHPLVGRILESIRNPYNQQLLTTTRAWYSVGPGVLTRIYNETPKEEKITVFPSHMFLPRHHTGLCYSGHEKIYAHQFWGTNDRSYESVENMVVPLEFTQEPDRWVSVIVTSLNTPANYVFDCLQSIQKQTGRFGIELVWVNDGSDKKHTEELKYYLKIFQETSRFIRTKYLENTENLGCRRSLRRAIENCSYDLIFKMDADDMMLPKRIHLQMRFMDNNPNIPVCGGQMAFYQGDKITQTTQHPAEISWDTFIHSNPKPTWFMNHPTLCFRKEALLSVGNYPDTPLSIEHPEKNMMDDYELELKFLKKYGCLCNLPDTLLKYRIHPNQMTQKFPDTDSKMVAWRDEIIQNVLSSGEPKKLVDDVNENIVYEIKEPSKQPVVFSNPNDFPVPSKLPFHVLTYSSTDKSNPEVMVNIDKKPVVSFQEPPTIDTGVYKPSHCVYI